MSGDEGARPASTPAGDDGRDPQVPPLPPRNGPEAPPPEPVTSWQAPAWTSRTYVDSGGIVQHSRPVAEVRLLDQQPGGAFVVEAVEVSQADWVVAEDDGEVRVEREAPEVYVGGLRLSSAEARRLAASLVVAADIIDAGLVEQLPAAER